MTFMAHGLQVPIEGDELLEYLKEDLAQVPDSGTGE